MGTYRKEKDNSVKVGTPVVRVKKRSRWKKVLVWTLSIVVVLGAAGVFAANYAINKVMDAMVADLTLDVPDEPAGVQGEQQTGDTPSGQSEGDDKKTDVPASQPEGQNTAGTTGDQAEGSSGSGKGTPPATEEAGIQAGGDKEADLSYAAEVSTGKAKTIQDKITATEKAKVTSILLKQLSVADIKKLQALAGGGLSIEEKKEARQIFLDKMSPEQYNELIEVAKKYGASEGRKYEEVKQDGSAAGK